VYVGGTNNVGILMMRVIILAQIQHVQNITNNRTLCYVTIVVVAWSHHMQLSPWRDITDDDENANARLHD
jgi:hypothetical protein